MDYTGIYVDWNLDLDNINLDEDQSTGVDDLWDFGASQPVPGTEGGLEWRWCRHRPGVR